MIIIHTKTGKRYEFRLPAEAEDKVLSAWRAMGNEPAYAKKVFKFTDRITKAPYLFYLANIKECLVVTEAVFEAVEPEKKG